MKASSITTKVVIALFFHPHRFASPTYHRARAFRPSIRSVATSSLLLNNSISTFGNTVCRNITAASQSVYQTKLSNSTNYNIIKQNNMSSAIESMPRGIDGRIEEAFAKCKERGEAAFVTFVTAGFPVKEGEFICLYGWRVDLLERVDFVMLGLCCWGDGRELATLGCSESFIAYPGMSYYDLFRVSIPSHILLFFSLLY